MRIGHSREAINTVLTLLKDDELVGLIESYRRSLSHDSQLYWDLQSSQPEKISLTDDTDLSLIPFPEDSDDHLRRQADVIPSSFGPRTSAYEQALAYHKDYDVILHIQALCDAGLDNRLFDLLSRMNLGQVLPLLKRWTTMQWCPDDSDQHALFTQTVSLFEQLNERSPPGALDMGWLRDYRMAMNRVLSVRLPR